MKKDYIPVSKEDSLLSEADHIEKFWTQRWSERGISADVSKNIEQNEEFKILGSYLKKIGSGAKILDGGCGVGNWSLYLTSRGFDVTGIDLSSETIQQLQEKFSNVNFVHGDIRDTKLCANSFDLYFSWGTFEHFEEGLESAFKEAYRILKPGGYLVISVPFQNQRHLKRDLGKLASWDSHYSETEGYQSKMRFYQWRLTIPELQREFEINGFKVMETSPIHRSQGVSRMLQGDFNLNSGALWVKVLREFITPITPRKYASHMLMGVGKKL